LLLTLALSQKFIGGYMKQVIALALAAIAVAAPSMADAAIVQVQFSGTDNSSLDVYSSGYSSDTTPFSGTITYNSNALGVTDPNFSYITDYNSAIQSLTLNFGGNQYVASGGTLDVSDGGPSSEHAVFFTFTVSGPTINSEPVTSFDLALRSGTSTGTTALPTSFTLADFTNGNGGNNTVVYLSGGFGTPQFFGIPSIADASTVPLPAAAWLLLSGLGGLGFFPRKRLGTQNRCPR
jgi:hypothetical protein